MLSVLPSRPPGADRRPGPCRPRAGRHVIILTQGQENAMPRFMDLHEDLKLPAEAIAQIADDTRHARADQFGVRQIELYYNPDGTVYCLLEGPDEDAIRQHHAALGVPCGEVHQVDSLTWPGRTGQSQPGASNEHPRISHEGPPGRHGTSRRARPPAPGGAASAQGGPASSRACRSRRHRSGLAGEAVGPADVPPRYRIAP